MHRRCARLVQPMLAIPRQALIDGQHVTTTGSRKGHTRQALGLVEQLRPHLGRRRVPRRFTQSFHALTSLQENIHAA